LGILLLPVKAYAEAKDPFSAVVRVNRAIDGHCSGFAIDARRILTATHCLWPERLRNWIRPTSLHVLSEVDQGQHRQHLRVIEYRVSAGYAPKLGDPDRAADWAVLMLDKAFSWASAP
jgi:protease YdgD